MNQRSSIRKTWMLLGILSAFLISAGCTDSETQERAESTAKNAAVEAKRMFQIPEVFAGVETNTLADIAEARINSVVNISSTRVVQQRPFGQSPLFEHPFFRDFFGQPFRGIPPERRERSLGSGVIVSQNGTILTNYHVVAEADEILVTLTDDREFNAKVVGSDPQSDVAVIRLEETPPNLEPLPFGDSSQLRMGDIVLAIGNPFGLAHTVTMGIVSATGRANVGIADYEDFIQTDAAINPGNSGGALVNLKGEFIGINTAIVSRTGGYQGIGFAIPSNMAQSVMESLIEHGKVVRGWLGVVIQDIDRDLADAMGLDTSQGVLVSDVMKDSPAQKAGLQREDVILQVNDTQVDNTGQLRNTIATLGAGAEVTLTILRDGEEKEITLTLGERPDEEQLQAGKMETEEGLLQGLSVGPLTPLTRQQFNIPDSVKEGVVVTNVERGSAAHRYGLRPGDVILEVNRQSVDSVEAFQDAYSQSDERMLLLIQRQGATLFLTLKK